MTVDLLWSGAAIFVLLILSAIFSGSETALTAASEARMHQLARLGNSRAHIVNRLRDQKERLIGTILLGNNLVNIMASALATNMLVIALGQTGVLIATIAMTALILIFSEVLPKTYAINNADRVALTIAPLARYTVALLSPVSHGIQVIVKMILRMLGGDPRADIGVTSEEELRGAIELHAQASEEMKDERAMLHSILDLEDVEVSEIMTHRRNMVTIDLNKPVDEILDVILTSPFTRLPVWKDDPDNIIGVVHAKAVLRALAANRREISKLDELEIGTLALEPWFIPETTTLIQQLQAFRQRHEHFALVVDEFGSLMGLVTLEDILEEIVGDITDEHDQRLTGIQDQGDGSYIVAGTVTVRDLNREMDWTLPDEQAATIAGLVMHEARRIPETGQSFSMFGYRIEVLRRKHNQILTLMIRPEGKNTPS